MPMVGIKYIEKVRLDNILSYGGNDEAFCLEPLNVLIGPNASGKSNLIEALSILAAAPRDIQVPIREGGGVHEWPWKGPAKNPLATIEVTVDSLLKLTPPIPIRYRLTFSDLSGRFMIDNEVIEDEYSSTSGEDPESYYHYKHGQSTISFKDKSSPKRDQLIDKNVDTGQSILSQRVDPRFYPELGYLGEVFKHIRIYRDFHLGPNSPLRYPPAN